MTKDYFYIEWVKYDDEKKKEEAKTYLKLWKKFLIKKFEYKFIDEEWVDMPASLAYDQSLGLKIKVEDTLERKYNEAK
jgi:hypothetical protein